jgi:hypothetical protein
MNYEYNKKCFTFGKIKRIYFFKYTYYVELTNKQIINLNDININDFKNSIDIKVLNEVLLADSIDGRVYFTDEFD